MTNKEHYRAFCATASDLPLWVHDWYLDATCEDGIWDVVIVFRGEQVIATLPYFIKTRAGFRYITMPLFVKAMGPYLIPELRTLKKQHQLYKELIEQLPKVDGFKQNFHPLISNWLPFYWKVYQQTTYYTYQFDDLSDLAAIKRNANKSIQRNIRKAEQLLTIDYELSAEEFYEINTWSFKRQAIPPPYTKAQFLRLDAALEKQQARQIFCARDADGQIHSAAYLVWDKKIAYYLFSGDHPDLRKSGSGILLLWEAIQYTSKVLELNCFDFEGSIIQRLETLRVQFGAKQVPYFYIWKYHSRLYRMLNKIGGR